MLFLVSRYPLTFVRRRRLRTPATITSRPAEGRHPYEQSPKRSPRDARPADLPPPRNRTLRRAQPRCPAPIRLPVDSLIMTRPSRPPAPTTGPRDGAATVNLVEESSPRVAGHPSMHREFSPTRHPAPPPPRRRDNHRSAAPTPARRDLPHPLPRFAKSTRPARGHTSSAISPTRSAAASRAERRRQRRLLARRTPRSASAPSTKAIPPRR